MNGKAKIQSVCWDITSHCNDCCKYCYRNKFSNDASIDLNRIIIEKLLEYGTGKISFVGGEPLLYKDLFSLVDYAKEMKKKTVFSITTNAILLAPFQNGEIILNEPLIQNVLDRFDWITFPLDAIRQEIQNEMGRNEHHFIRIRKMLEHMSNEKYTNKIKINTVASALNYKYIEEMYDVLSSYGVSRWKIFRFLPSRGDALKNKKQFNITDEQFFDLKSRINHVSKEGVIKVTFNDHSEFDNSYITISSDGQLQVYNHNEYTNNVNLAKDSIDTFSMYINFKKHQLLRSAFADV